MFPKLTRPFRRAGPRAVQILATEDLQPVLEVRHGGPSNFVVDSIGYGETSGSELLVNEIGNCSGQTLVDHSGLSWARLDSNQGPTDYESAALTS
jgi:hypothetical protein